MPLGCWTRPATPESLLEGTYEVLARALHEEHVRLSSEMGLAARSDLSVAPWEDLAEELRERNRMQARHIHVELDQLHCAIAPLTDWDAPPLGFTAQEVELLARMEHECAPGWDTTRASQGRRGSRGAGLVPWDELPAENKERARNRARSLPVLLARAGFQVYRLQ